jgi:hypothetical protein
MSFNDWLTEGLLREHPLRAGELEALLSAVDRDLADAAVPGLSADAQFGLAYEAALGLATMLLRSRALRAGGEGHHLATIQAISEIMGAGERKRADYFDHCRRKRHVSVYERAGQISRAESEELLLEARVFRTIVLGHLREEHPTIAP